MDFMPRHLVQVGPRASLRWCDSIVIQCIRRYGLSVLNMCKQTILVVMRNMRPTKLTRGGDGSSDETEGHGCRYSPIRGDPWRACLLPLASSSLAALRCRERLRRRRKSNMPSRIVRPTTPPTMPPTIAPVSLLDFLGAGGVGSNVGVAVGVQMVLSTGLASELP